MSLTSIHEQGKFSRFKKILYGFIALFIMPVIFVMLVLSYIFIIASPSMPSLNILTNYQPKIPLRIYTSDRVLIGEFGKERRNIVHFNEIPDSLKKAILAIEDARFYNHSGIDLAGIFRAGIVALTNGYAKQGASTITMQVARNFFLSNKKTFKRKIYEILLAYRIERALTKDKIFEIYINQIYLGHHTYGFETAAQTYFNKNLKNITLAEAAMLAGIPKAPASYNPISNLKRAKIRQQYILKRMLNLRFITQTEYNEAITQPISIRESKHEYRVHAEYVAEIVRQMMYLQYQEEAYTRGFKVITTINSSNQDAAYRAMRHGIINYEKYHDYRGPEGFVNLPADLNSRRQVIKNALTEHIDNNEIASAVVTEVNTNQIKVVFVDGKEVKIKGENLRFAMDVLSSEKRSKKRLFRGSIVRVVKNKNNQWTITQLPQVEGAFVSIIPQDGAICSLIGGFDYGKNKFNHVTQAWRQPGSSFKPFIYSAALDKGIGPKTIINDEPLYFRSNKVGGQVWEPKNYGSNFSGEITMRKALERSNNLVSIRILIYIGIEYAQQYIRRFGFDIDRHPAYLPMALGSGSVTPLQMAVAYSVFANGGYLINPYLIAEVSDSNGEIIMRAQPLVAEKNAPRTINSRNAYIMNNLLQGVVQSGTASKTNVLKRADLAGKTGTTNNSRDAWFAGYQHNLTAVSWIGYDNPRSLGKKETGAVLAVPVWVEYMQDALKNTPEFIPIIPEGIETICGELYFSNFLPGNGFISTINIPQTIQIPSNIAEKDNKKSTPSSSERYVSKQEKDDIMRLFHIY
ncbi:MAG: penicillin-binding protein 1A [Burkholderia sp.]|nr:penicillin-binding protein 1A [Burkholderia sp.]